MGWLADSVSQQPDTDYSASSPLSQTPNSSFGPQSTTAAPTVGGFSLPSSFGGVNTQDIFNFFGNAASVGGQLVGGVAQPFKEIGANLVTSGRNLVNQLSGRGSTLDPSIFNNPFLSPQETLNLYKGGPTQAVLRNLGSRLEAAIYADPLASIPGALATGGKTLAEAGVRGALKPIGGPLVKTAFGPVKEAATNPSLISKLRTPFSLINTPARVLNAIPAIRAGSQVAAPLVGAGLRSVVGGGAADIASTWLPREDLPFGQTTQNINQANQNPTVQALNLLALPFLGGAAGAERANAVRTAESKLSQAGRSAEEVTKQTGEHPIFQILRDATGNKNIGDEIAKDQPVGQLVLRNIIDTARRLQAQDLGIADWKTIPEGKVTEDRLRTVTNQIVNGKTDLQSIYKGLGNLQNAQDQAEAIKAKAANLGIDLGQIAPHTQRQYDAIVGASPHGESKGAYAVSKLNDVITELRGGLEQDFGSNRAISQTLYGTRSGLGVLTPEEIRRLYPDQAERLFDLKNVEDLQKQLVQLEKTTGYHIGPGHENFVFPGHAGEVQPIEQLATTGNKGEQALGVASKFGLSPFQTTERELGAMQQNKLQRLINDYVQTQGGGVKAAGKYGQSGSDIFDALYRGTGETKGRNIIQFANDNHKVENALGMIRTLRDVPNADWRAYLGDKELGDKFAQFARESYIAPWRLTGLANWVNVARQLGPVNSLIKVLDAARFGINAEFIARLQFKNRALMGENGYDSFQAPLGGGKDAAVLTAVKNQSNSILQNMEARNLQQIQPELDEGIQTDRKTLGGWLAYDPLSHESQVARQYIQKATGVNVQSVEDVERVAKAAPEVIAGANKEIARIFHYEQGRSPIERSINALFFPFSFEKKVYREAGAFFQANPGMALLAQNLVNQEETWANSDEGQQFRTVPTLGRDLAQEAGKIFPFKLGALSPTYQKAQFDLGLPGGSYLGRAVEPFLQDREVGTTAYQSKTPFPFQVLNQLFPETKQGAHFFDFQNATNNPDYFTTGTPGAIRRFETAQAKKSVK